MKLIKRNSEVDLPITSGCLYRKELMKEHFVRLVFDDVSDDVVEVGDYVVWEGVKYTLLKPYIPEQIEIGKYRYNVELQAPEMLWKQKYFVYKDADKDIETEWVMRADAHTWMQAIAKAIKLETGKDVTYKVSELLEGTQFIEIDHDTIFSGLNKIAEAFKTEWWYDGELHLSRCEHGDRIDLIVGDNVNAPKVEQKGDYFTRLIPLGSDRNIPQNTDATYVNYKNRLKLDKVKYPNGYIDVVDVPLEEVVPKTVIFEDIYPKSYLKISEVKSDYNEEDKQYVYSVKLENYTLTKDLILEELIPNISFRDGLLNGRTFELNVGEWLTLINQEEGGIIIPNKNLKPRVGDSIILTNIKMPDEYIKAAQEDLEYEALRVVARQEQDLNSYRIRTCPINFKDEIDVGSKVLLDDFGKETNTRVLSVEYNLDTPSSKELNIGNNITKGFIDRILEEAEIDKLKAQLKKGKDGNSVTLKGKLDSTDKLPTNPKKGDSYWIGTVLYTWNGIDWVTQDLQGEHGTNGSDGSTPYIGYNGNWWIGDSDLGIKAEGIDGDTPYIKDGYWWIGNRNTGVKAEGKDGADGYTPYIENGYWYINGQNTGFVAKGEDGKDGLKGEDGSTPYIGYNGNWFIDGQDTGMKSTGESGPITYIAGLYNDSVTYKGTITKRPVVYQPDNDLVPRIGSYYFLKNIGEFKGKSPRDNPTVWEKADEFNVILTDTLVAHFAKVGGAVFYGDLMMSQWGTDARGNQSSNYDQYPNNFTPYLWFNFKTGDGSLNGNIEIGGNATFKGNLDGATGTFTGYLKSDFIEIEKSDAIYKGEGSDGKSIYQLKDNLNVITTERHHIVLPDEAKYAGATVMIYPVGSSGTYITTSSTNLIRNTNFSDSYDDRLAINISKRHNCIALTQIVAGIRNRNIEWNIVNNVDRDVLKRSVSLTIDLEYNVGLYSGLFPDVEITNFNKNNINPIFRGRYIDEIYIVGKSSNREITLNRYITRDVIPPITVVNATGSGSVIVNDISISKMAVIKPLSYSPYDSVKTWVKLI